MRMGSTSLHVGVGPAVSAAYPVHKQGQLTALIQRHRKIFSDNALLGVEEQEDWRFIELHNLQSVTRQMLAVTRFCQP